MARMTVADKLGLDVFHTDEGNPHITIHKDYKNEEEIHKLVLACPAALYVYENGEVQFSYEGCLECGTCRVISGGKVIDTWNHPIGETGVQFRQG